MSRFMKNHARKIIAVTAALGMVAVVGASALDTDASSVRLSSNLSSSVGVALTAKDVTIAEEALNKAAITSVSAAAQIKAEADAKAQAAIAAEEQSKADIASQLDVQTSNSAQDDPELTAPQVQVNQTSNSVSNSSNTASETTESQTASQPSSSTGDDSSMSNATSLGQFELTFYCPCAYCNGSDEKISALGTPLVVGQTIAVDPSVIPLGSRVYIEGHGTFIAEDTGGLIKGNIIDILVESHESTKGLGRQRANVYILN